MIPGLWGPPSRPIRPTSIIPRPETYTNCSTCLNIGIVIIVIIFIVHSRYSPICNNFDWHKDNPNYGEEISAGQPVINFRIQLHLALCWMFLGPAIWINSLANFGYISVSTFDLLGPGQHLHLDIYLYQIHKKALHHIYHHDHHDGWDGGGTIYHLGWIGGEDQRTVRLMMLIALIQHHSNHHQCLHSTTRMADSVLLLCTWPKNLDLRHQVGYRKMSRGLKAKGPHPKFSEAKSAPI